MISSGTPNNIRKVIKFWSKKPKRPAVKQAKPPPKKTKGKGKAAAAEASEGDESQVRDAPSENEDNESEEDSVEVISVSSDSSPSPPKPARRICGKVPFSHPNACLDPNFLLKKAQHTSNRKTRSHSGDLVSGLPAKNKRKQNENSPPTSGDSVMSTLPPMIRVPGAHAKKRKTSGSTPIIISEPIKESAPIQDNPDQDEPEDQMDLPSSPKETTDAPKPPSPLTTTEDPDAVIITVMGAKEPITSIKKMLGCLSTLPPQIGELTWSAARKGVLTTLSRCLAYAPEINPEEVAAGFPQLKDDGSEFVEEDYQRVVKDSRLAATQLAASLDLSKYQAAYDSKNKKVNPPTFVTTNLTPRRPKNPFDLDADLSSILTDEDDIAALAKCNWVLGNLQIEVGQSSQQNDPRVPAE
ncbi:hypothetical protein ZWY2020_056599 [Hordeum vulgare]|nr:hypothetical protein ZWY2020_056599 [Hordeum vulgare]